jgi:hypothetical protein
MSSHSLKTIFTPSQIDKEIMVSTYAGFLNNKMLNRAIYKRTLESESGGKFIHKQIHSVIQGVEHFYAKNSKLNC